MQIGKVVFSQSAPIIIETDNSLTFKQLRRNNVERCEQVFHKLNYWSLSDWTTALCGKLGEAANIIKKIRRLDSADKDKDSPKHREELFNKLKLELANVQIYLDLLAAAAGIDLGKATIEKFNKVSKKRGSDILLG